jgi:hypothetical protein
MLPACSLDAEGLQSLPQAGTYIQVSDDVGLVLFHCFSKYVYFICLMREGPYGSEYIEHKVQILCVL